ncbi:MAG: serine/threonine-protein kinase [Kibdelosporangium sp.]
MRVVAGRYAIRDELGRGGMGVVWRADDQVIGRQVALKELPSPQGLTGDGKATYLERVLREARTAGRLNDPAVVTVFDVISENGVTYIVMELVEAPTLADVIAEEGPLPADRVMALGLQVLGALETAHAAGIVHRDVKPSNIMVLPGNRVKLADFGIARAMDDPNLTMTGGIMGSPGYMAPELFSGSPPAPPSDLWALGATLFHAVEGRSPFNRETTAATMHAIMYDDPQLTKVQGPVAQVIMGLLAQPVEARLTVARTRELLTAPPEATQAVIAETTQVVDAPTVRVMAVQRNTLPREPWQEAFPEQLPLAAPAPVNWGHDDWTPKKKPGRARLMLLTGAGAAVVAALVAVFLISPGGGTGEAAPPGTSTVAAVAGTQNPIETTPWSSAPPTTVSQSSTVSSPPVSTVTVTKSGNAPVKQPTPPAGQPTVGQPPPPPPDKPQRGLVQLVRYNHPKGPHFTATPSVPAPGGFSREFPMGWLVQASEPGTKRLYACQLKGSEDRMTSTDAACEGHTQIGLLGYIFTSKPAGVNSKLLYRCTYTGGHYDSTDAKCEGYTTEFQFGWLIV